MDDLHLLEVIILLMVVVLALTAIAEKLLIPYPILLVIGGLILALVPELPVVHLDPDLVFLVFLPPILWSAAYFTSFRDFRANIRPIGLLAVGLVLATTAAVAAVARVLLPDMGGLQRSLWGPLSRPRMRYRRLPSRSAYIFHAGSSRSWKVRVWSTTPPRSCCTVPPWLQS